jgi:hypothetical protein
MQISSLLVLLCAMRRLEGPGDRVLDNRPLDTSVFIGLAMFQLCISIPLNDGSPMMKFPFEHLIARVVAIHTGQAPFINVK